MDYRIDQMPPYLLGTISEAVNNVRKQGHDVIDFSQANCDLPPPAIAVDKLIQACLHPANHRYSSSQGINKLRNAITLRYKKRFSVELDPDSEVCVTLGAKEGLAHTLLALTKCGDQVVIPSPCYPVHSGAIAIAECHQISIPMNLDQASFDEHQLFNDIVNVYCNTWPKPKVLLFSFPHNPTTAVVSLNFWKDIVSFAQAEKLIVLNDFAYGELCYSEFKAPSILEVPSAKEVAVEFYSISKAFALGGWRVGFALGGSGLIAKLKKIKGYIDFGIFQPLQIAAVSVIEKSDEILEETLNVYQSRRDSLAAGLISAGFQLTIPQASVFLWAKLPDGISSDDSEVFCRYLLQAKHIALCPGSGFDLRARSYVRLALMESESRVRTAVKSITSFIGECK
ncbi:MAG: aminotransferase class I/II-fold pyridoxal phosphate-dependent enzyme [Deltaproteobacteria bacterium]|nr:aminotransferase class I/II-fold pyridoxal phosphate-dependent enzyme [Deltaproteobacteria bacterium]